jgi:hypothetical protein
VQKISVVRALGSTITAAALAGATPSIARSQATAHPASHGAAEARPSSDQIEALAKLTVTISQARDSAQKQLALTRNTSPLMQQQLQDQLAAQIAGILSQAGVSASDYRRQTYVVSTDSAARTIYDRTIAKLTGAPAPGQLPPALNAAVAVPAGAVGIHIGHIMNAFADTPGGQGLLPTALAEARTAAQHAALAARDPGNLDGMKLHAGHVINAVDPSVVSTGPGLGYGVKRAALGIATHVDLAAKAAGASPQVVMHAGHVGTSARNTVQRADQIVAIAKRVQAATSAGDALSLVSQLVALTTELVAGRDADADGKTTWKEGEGGLQHCEEHMRLMLAPSP